MQDKMLVDVVWRDQWGISQVEAIFLDKMPAVGETLGFYDSFNNKDVMLRVTKASYGGGLLRRKAQINGKLLPDGESA